MVHRSDHIQNEIRLLHVQQGERALLKRVQKGGLLGLETWHS